MAIAVISSGESSAAFLIARLAANDALHILTTPASETGISGTNQNLPFKRHKYVPSLATGTNCRNCSSIEVFRHMMLISELIAALYIERIPSPAGRSNGQCSPAILT